MQGRSFYPGTPEPIMDMDLVVTFVFVATIVLIIVGGIVLFPIARKLGHFLEEAARERAAARGRGDSAMLGSAPPDLADTLARMEDRLEAIATRQAFVERLIEERPTRTLESAPRD